MDTPCHLIICRNVFHVVKNKGTEDFKKMPFKDLLKHDYKVTSKANRME